MKWKKSTLFTLFLLVFSAGIHWYSSNSLRVENGFSSSMYPVIGRFFRLLTGWFPYSFGDILYGVAIAWLIWETGKLVQRLLKKQSSRNGLKTRALKTLQAILVIYVVFNVFWGINYNRLGIAQQLQLPMAKYSAADLKTLNTLLVEKINVAKQALVNNAVPYPETKQLFTKVDDAYFAAAKKYPFLRYKPMSLKPSIWSWFGNYLGFTGYYNPFTGEAQVNTLVPPFLQPFIGCHEVAHQLGYAKESEANFVGYLAGTASPDTLLHYSIYLDLFVYSNRNLFENDSSAALNMYKQLSTDVRADLETWRTFNRKHKNPVEPVIRWIYDLYLQGNQQPQGVLSYDEVTGYLIAYYKKFGRI